MALVRICRVDEVPEGEARRFAHDGREIAIVNLGRDGFRAIDAVCSHAHEYLDSWASTEAAEFLLAYYYYGHTNTEADLSVVSDGVREALGLDDPSVLEEPNSHPESPIARRDVYQQYWSEVQAS